MAVDTFGEGRVMEAESNIPDRRKQFTERQVEMWGRSSGWENHLLPHTQLLRHITPECWVHF